MLNVAVDSIYLLITNPFCYPSCKTNEKILLLGGKGSRSRICRRICPKDSLSPRETTKYTPIEENSLKA